MQELNDLRLVSRFHTGEQTSPGAGGLLFRRRKIVELAPRIRLPGRVLVFTEHTDTSADSFRGGLVVPSNHDYADTSGTTPGNGVEYFLARRVEHTDDTDERQILLVRVELGGIVKIHIVGFHGVVSSGKGEAAQGVSAGTILASQF